MMLRKIASYVGVALLAALTIFAVYEAFRVRAAQEQVAALFAPYTGSEDPAVLQWQALSPWQQDSLIRIEDPNFFAHGGVDLTTRGAGLTTITQALTKRLFFEKFEPGFAKIEQSLIAYFVVTPNIGKEQQLTAFLNVAYMGQVDGQPVIGFANAATAYFGKTVDQLTEDEFLRLVGMLIAPASLAPTPGNARSDARLARMQNLLGGKCAPQSLFDVQLEACE